MSKFNPMKYGVPILKRLYPSIRKRLAQIFWRGDYTIVSSGGALFLVNYRNFVDRQIAFYDDFEAEQIAYLMKAMGERGCDLFLDIGANIGLYSVRVGRAKLAQRLVAFEPDPRNVHQLGANLLINGLTGRVEVIAKAVSNRSGLVPFQFYADSSTGQSRVDENSAVDSVGAIRADDYIQLRDGIIFAKIDVEGHELAVIEGMAETFCANRIFLQIESFPEQFEKLSKMLAAQAFHELHHIGDDHYFANF
jgi:FkbM family methyltransferase